MAHLDAPMPLVYRRCLAHVPGGRAGSAQGGVGPHGEEGDDVPVQLLLILLDDQEIIPAIIADLPTRRAQKSRGSPRFRPVPTPATATREAA